MGMDGIMRVGWKGKPREVEEQKQEEFRRRSWKNKVKRQVKYRQSINLGLREGGKSKFGVCKGKKGQMFVGLGSKAKIMGAVGGSGNEGESEKVKHCE